ncbi:hypothetical protein PF004_g17341 [Phytophthora fragariae]|uniref:UDENN domain-containing protein n=1 Tax=Phytophthora fragariae TaxID=53985 RepID=A0A6G0NFR2_9STRA|nr:hypothetical protein PF004_g17341 [Phytophthora fragariae]
MADGDVPRAERTWSASNLLQSVAEAAAAVQPLPANFGKLVDTVLASPSKVDLSQDGSQSTSMRPDGGVLQESMEPRSPNILISPSSPANKPLPSNTLSVLSAAAASLKDKTQQVAQQQKRALSAFQQKGGLVSWLHGEMDESDSRSFNKSVNSTAWPAASAPTSPTHQTDGDFLSFVDTSDRDDLRTPPSPRSLAESPIPPGIAGRRRSMPNMKSGSLLDNLFDKVTGGATSPTVQSSSASPQARVKLRPAVSTTRSPTASFDDFVNGQQAGIHPPRSEAPSSPEAGRLRAVTMELKPNAGDGSLSPALVKVRSAASLSSSRPSAETRFSLDDVLSDEWSSTVLWVFLYSSASGRDPQHHQRMSFLIETTFRITPLYRKLAGTNDTDSKWEYTKLVARLKRLHSRFLVHNGAATLSKSGVPVASPAASHAKNQLAVAIHTLSDQKVPSNGLALDARVEKTVSLLLQLAREVEREFRVLGTRSYANFADSLLYRDFIAHGSGHGKIAMLLRAARIPFYQQPSGVVDPVSLNDFASKQGATAATVFALTRCQVFVVAVLPDGSINFTDVSPNDTEKSTPEQTILQQTIEPFLNPSASIHPAASKPLAFNFSAGSGDKLVYGAVMWLPVGLNDTPGTEELPRGICIISRFPLVDSMRHFLSSLLTRSGGTFKHCGADTMSIAQEDAEYASLSMGRHFLAGNREHQLGEPDINLLPADDFKLSDLFDCLSLTNVLRLFAFVLLEKKIVLVASSYTILLSVGEALRSLLHPLVWSHVYVPVLPLALKDCLQCPTPFIFGLHDSYVRRSDMPRPSHDLVIVNLDRDSLTGGGDVFLPPVRHSMLREELFRLCKPHLTSRDSVDSFDAAASSSEFPTSAIRRLFRKHLTEILASLEPCVTRFELNGQCVSVVDNVNSNQWPADTARFCSAMLHTQAVSTYLASPRSDDRANVDRIFV